MLTNNDASRRNIWKGSKGLLGSDYRELFMLSILFENLNSHFTPSFSEELSERLSSRKLRFLLLSQLEFDASGDLLKQILEGNYKDGIDGFEEVKNDGKKITGIFSDIVNSKLTKRYKFEVSENGISYQLENPNDIKDDADYSEINFARTKMFGQSKQPKKCVKGTSCGNGCIKKGLKCSKPPTPQQKEAIASLLKPRKAKTKKVKPVAEPQAEAKLSAFKSGLKQTSYGADVNKKIEEWSKFLEKESVANGGTDWDRIDNKMIVTLIAGQMSSPDFAPDNFVGISDDDGNLQSTALIKKKEGHIYVDFLATAPWNLGNGGAKQVKGAGITAMEAIIQKSIDSGFKGQVRLESLPDAEAFYKKIGFKVAKNAEGVREFRLSAAAAKDFLQKRGNKSA
jgi:hypothetical protein